VLLATLLGCGSNIGTQESVSDTEKATIDKLVATHLSDDFQAMGDLYTKDAVLSDYLAGSTIEGRDAIVTYVSGYPGLDWRLSTDAFKVGPYVVQPVTLLQDGNPVAQGVHVYEMNGDGQIKHIWVSVPRDEE
jgi:hypothetical protein